MEKEYFKAERYLNSLLNLSIVKKVPLKTQNNIIHASFEYFKKEGVPEEFIIHGIELKRMKALMDRLDHPYKNLKILHVAGTSGKGSVSMIAHNILKRTSLKVGLYTSPHLTLVMERIKTGDLLISPDDFVKYLKLVKDATDDMYENDIYGPPSYHETIFSTALLYFNNENPDISVIETGLGWRNDYTKILPSSLVSIITNISYDHTDYLGDTLESIASNKSDIISEKSICITGCNSRNLLSIIRKKAEEKGSLLSVIGEDFQIKLLECGKEKSFFDYESKYNRYKNLEIGLMGKHQALNGCIAIAAVEEIGKLCGVKIEEHIIREALKEVKIPGRLEYVSKKPLVILDGAHNPAKIESLCDHLRELEISGKIITILGIIEGKDIRYIVNKVLSVSNLIIATLPRVAGRVSVSPKNIARTVKDMGGRALIKLDPFDALNYAMSIAEEKDLICITGSLYLVGELRTEWFSKEDIVNRRKNN